jgi:transcriptional regulator with XRE-family HTH domain
MPRLRTGIDDVLRLRRAGLGYAEIARLLGISRQAAEAAVNVAAARSRNPIARLVEAMGGRGAFARAAGISEQAVRRLVAGRQPSRDTCDRVLELLDRLDGKLDSGLLEQARRYIEERRPERVSMTVVAVPTHVVLALGDEAVPHLARIAADAAREALADARAGRPLRPGPARIGVGRVQIKLTLPLQDLRDLEEAVRLDGRSLSAVIAAYMERRARSSE